MNGKDTLETAIADLVQKSFARWKLDAKIKDAQSLAAAKQHEGRALDGVEDVDDSNWGDLDP